MPEAPQNDPSPPMTTTSKEIKSRSTPEKGVKVVRSASINPATPASANDNPITIL
jgi:hypothetical protein